MDKVQHETTETTKEKRWPLGLFQSLCYVYGMINTVKVVTDFLLLLYSNSDPVSLVSAILYFIHLKNIRKVPQET